MVPVHGHEIQVTRPVILAPPAAYQHALDTTISELLGFFFFDFCSIVKINY